MVVGFHRSFSLPGSPRPKSRPANAYHVRSISLPCRSHPLISQLEYEIRSANNWISTKPEPDNGSASASWICDGLNRLDLLHVSLTDLLHLPQHHHFLRRGSGWSVRILDDFLKLADAHGSFRSEMVAMSEIESESQSAIRRKDAARIPICVRSMKRIEKELVKIAASLREISKSATATRFAIGSMEEAELAGVVREVIGVTVSVSVSVVSEAAAVVAGVATAVAGLATAKNTWTPLRRSTTTTSRLVKMSDNATAMEKLEGGEEWMTAVESVSERLFKSLVNARVNLLNILTL